MTSVTVMTNATGIEVKLKRASLLIATGMAVQLLSLLKVHPLAFMAFLLVGCPLVAAGILLYLWALVSRPH